MKDGDTDSWQILKSLLVHASLRQIFSYGSGGRAVAAFPGSSSSLFICIPWQGARQAPEHR